MTGPNESPVSARSQEKPGDFFLRRSTRIRVEMKRWPTPAKRSPARKETGKGKYIRRLAKLVKTLEALPIETIEKAKSYSTVRDSATLRVMAQIYKDIHAFSLPNLVQNILDENNRPSFLANFACKTQAMFRAIEYALSWEHLRSGKDGKLYTDIFTVVDQLSNRSDKLGRVSRFAKAEESLSMRYAKFASEHGWMMLSILANSAAFREAARTLGEDPWSAVVDSVYRNRNSIEIFAKCRGLNWTNALEQTEKIASYISERRETYTGIVTDHPHSYIVDLNSTNLERAKYERITENIYDPKDWAKYRNPEKKPKGWPAEKDYPSDPSVPQESCEYCKELCCDCDLQTSDDVVRPLIELVNYGAKGVGIRALQPIQNLKLLGEYLGKLVHPDNKEDNIYGLQFHCSATSACMATIQARQYGNWTRFLSHSCEPNSEFGPLVYGKKQRMMIETNRDIEMFEELTVDYNEAYWADKEFDCACVSTKCKYATQEQRDRVRKRLG